MEVDLTVADNPLSIPPPALFEMAARVNKKRGFLFVSKVLGKHIPVSPLKPLLASGLLAIEYAEKTSGLRIDGKDEVTAGFLAEDHESIKKAYDLLNKQRFQLPDPPIVIGFAETATALGHGVFDCLEGASFIHTTREILKDKHPVLLFEEEHSHAVDQRCYTDEPLFSAADRPVILVDDEITTGKTALNIIRDIQRKHPRREYAVLSLLDWRSEEHKEQFRKAESELGATISTIALLSGSVACEGQPLDQSLYDDQPHHREMNVSVRRIDISDCFTALPYRSEQTGAAPFVKETGRFGLSHEDKCGVETACQKAAGRLNALRKGKRVLCLGTGEFMYLPLKIASLMGEHVAYHSTTRSPIHPSDDEGYAVRNRFCFPNPENESVQHFIYNLPKRGYDEVFLFVETFVAEESLRPILAIFSDREIENVNIVAFSKGSVGNG
ncbi:phosphoribosyltransferase family protein [Bacillus sonorensis]|nr:MULTISPECIES: phosphoribosyltransferase family protein [Bacillus]UBF34985.1 phosphoribosyltransferase family protein [Bacillus sp. PM8313]MBG9917469.1 hypothetical protein [Bacillus sonorensis]MCF7619960.1 phosphoribosyltransferase family protein [Bacillus sonorensis]MCY7857073.1 phosphoribosyltransferase family protein [Bacillus sonorensis]MCY8027373.1 phosphoribosyltransferase family protein [Bacillus sonorensis]